MTPYGSPGSIGRSWFSSWWSISKVLHVVTCRMPGMPMPRPMRPDRFQSGLTCEVSEGSWTAGRTGFTKVCMSEKMRNPILGVWNPASSACYFYLHSGTTKVSRRFRRIACWSLRSLFVVVPFLVARCQPAAADRQGSYPIKLFYTSNIPIILCLAPSLSSGEWR